MLTLILLVFALVCFAFDSVQPVIVRFNLDSAGKAFLVGALIAKLFG